eukprot:Skav227544  [mRNA]  locus=scaffold2241:283723:285234:+ [translate_table: standard]
MDVELAPPRSRSAPWRCVSGYESAIAPGFLTGAAPTADRLYHANLLQSQRCRWCGAEKETIQHLAGGCDRVNSILGRPLLPFQDQPNMATHGIFEVPQVLLAQSLREWSGDDLPPLQRSDEMVTLWGDGSMVNADHFYSKTMGFAVVDAEGTVLYKHGVHDPMACSFKAEMCAFLAAVRLRGPNIHYVTDCKTLRDTFQMILLAGSVPLNISFAHWWAEIFETTGFGQQCAVTITWIRARQYDHSRRGIDMLHLNNLYADKAAREAAIAACPIEHRTVKAWKQILVNHHAWLCRLMKLISAQKDLDNAAAENPTMPDAGEGGDGFTLEQQVRNKYAGWEWDTPLVNFDWQCALNQCPHPPSSWRFSDRMWTLTCEFFMSLHWRINAEEKTSIYQLAYQLLKFTPITPPALDAKNSGFFLLYVDWLRFFLRTLKGTGICLLPNELKYNGRMIHYSNAYFPKGTLIGGTVAMDPHVRFSFARLLFMNPSISRSSSGWAIALATIV